MDWKDRMLYAIEVISISVMLSLAINQSEMVYLIPTFMFGCALAVNLYRVNYNNNLPRQENSMSRSRDPKYRERQDI